LGDSAKELDEAREGNIARPLSSDDKPKAGTTGK
jgi:hypothetical protein